MFFAPRDSEIYKPCGMFTAGHVISSTIFIIIVITCIILTLKLSNKAFNNLIKAFAVIFFTLEVIKIGYNFYYGYTYFDAWFPLAYCSIFIYSLFLAGFGNTKLKAVGNTFLSVCTYAGLFFMIFPTTSLMLHPLFHYLSMHSLLYHSAMIYVGFSVVIRGFIKPSAKNFLVYVLYIACFAVVAIIINSICNCNLMFYTQPYNMPIEFVVMVYEFSPLLYTALIFTAYSALYLLFILNYKITSRLRRKYEI